MVQVSFYLDAIEFCNSLGALRFCWVKDFIKMLHDKEWGKAFQSCYNPGKPNCSLCWDGSTFYFPFPKHFLFELKQMHHHLFENPFPFVHNKYTIHVILQLWASLALRHSPISNFHSIYIHVCVCIYKPQYNLSVWKNHCTFIGY